jgi:hypothetical protein
MREWKEGRKEQKEEGREGGRKEEREEGREGGKEERKEGREEGRCYLGKAFRLWPVQVQMYLQRMSRCSLRMIDGLF